MFGGKMAEQKSVDNFAASDYNLHLAWDKDWYKELSANMKKNVFESAVKKYPPLELHTRLHGVKAVSDDFVNHYAFRMMLDVLRGN